MKLRLIARRYAEAYAAFVKGNIGLEKAIEEVRALKRVIKESPELLNILLSPAVTASEKDKFIDLTLKSYFSREMILFLKLLIEKRRISLLVEMLEYLRENYAHGEAINAVIKTICPLDIKIIRQIKSKLEEKLGKKLFCYQDIDGSIIGGIQVVIGNTIIDGSLRKRLSDLREKIIAIRME